MWVRNGTLAPTLNSTFAPTFAPTTSANYSAYPDCLIDNLCLDHIDDKAWGIVVEVLIFAYAFIGLVSYGLPCLRSIAHSDVECSTRIRRLFATTIW